MEPVTAVEQTPAVPGKTGGMQLGVIFAERTHAERADIQRIDRVVLRIPPAREQDLFAVRTPTLGNIRAGMPGQLPGAPADHRDHKDVPVSGALAAKGNPFAI